jgi:hypothetical protein
MPLRMLAKSLAGAVVIALLLFLPAGTLAWPEAWIFLALFSGCSLATDLWLRRVDLDLLAQNRRSALL